MSRIREHNRLKNLKTPPKFAKTANDYGIPKEMFDDLVYIFNTYDKNSDGMINKKETDNILKKLKINKEFEDNYDLLSNENDEISFDNYIELLKKLSFFGKGESEEDNNEIIESFKFFDKNNDGTISTKELKYILTFLGDKMDENEVKEIFNQIDINNDGNINYTEFVNFWNKNN